ncbi:hypothetical protein FQN51_007568 [Onygenales sp. PD_10]|nr:hypothetical protein FQN51_007568 [Onygenales sp. PD_10]
MSLVAISKITVQSVAVNACSNTIAQVISAYRHDEYLEAKFPGSHDVHAEASMALPGKDQQSVKRESPGKSSSEREEEQKANPLQKLNVRNTVVKIMIDQTVGAVWMTVLFIVTISALQGQDVAAIKQSVYKDLIPIMTAGLKLWPMVSVVSFTIVPPEKRILVGNIFGMLWGIYLSLITEG